MTDIAGRLRAKAYDGKPQDILNSKGDLMLKAADRIAELEAALGWYAEQVRDCRKISKDGDVARTKLDRDGGNKARAALKGTP